MEQKLIRSKDAPQYYPFCRATIMKLAEKAGAIIRVGRCVLIDRTILDKYLQDQN